MELTWLLNSYMRSEKKRKPKQAVGSPSLKPKPPRYISAFCIEK